MKGIKLPKPIPSMRALILKDLSEREDLISVLSIWDEEDKKPKFDRKIIRPGRTIPNIQDFVINLQPFDGLTSLFGLRKRKSAKKTFYTGFNDEANSYIDFKFKSLSKAVHAGNYTLAQEIVGTLMNSAAYQVAATNHVLTNGHRKMTYKEVLIVSKQVDKLVKRKAGDINFSRVYIPKGNTYRPLGVPTVAGRIYLHMYNNCIVEGRKVTESNKQHGYLPGRGILTAGVEVVAMLTKPNIYEADYEGFFNNVTHRGLNAVLVNQMGLPKSEGKFIGMLNKSLVKLTGEDKIFEPDRQIIFDDKGKLTPNAQKGQDEHRQRLVEAGENRIPTGPLHTGYVVQDIRNVKVRDAEDIRILLQGLATYTQIRIAPFMKKKYITEQQAEQGIQLGLHKDRPTVQWEEKNKGVPQGAPTSCSLATLALRRFERIYDLICYADDVIYFPKSSDCDPAHDLTDERWGLIVNKSKSRGIKKDGVGLVDSFKFLGIRYFPPRKYPFDFGEIKEIILLYILIDFCLGFPIMSVLLIGTEIMRINTINRERFVADTRNGANLEFTQKESFLSGLAIARQLMIDSEYFKETTMNMSLQEGLEENYRKGMKLKNPLKLLFLKPFKNKIIASKIEDLKEQINLETPEGRNKRLRDIKEMLKQYKSYDERYSKIERDLERTLRDLMKPTDPEVITSLKKKIKSLEERLGVRNPLMGFFVSRMQTNSGNITTEQNFSLKYIAGSGCEQEGGRYSLEGILPRTRLNVFTASTFANHDLLDGLSDYKARDRKVRIRRVHTKAQKTWFNDFINRVVLNPSLKVNDMIF